jgi:D-alanyl-lipoteichoic acid acyltransferase DltB (MBOAT superfamily)
MKGFVESIILIVVFFILVMLSFVWFNKEKKSLQDVPYVGKVFSSISSFSEGLKDISIKEDILRNVFKRTKDGAQELAPENIEEW